MSISSTNLVQSPWQALALTGQRILHLLEWTARVSPRYRMLELYNAMSDEDLAKLGMTRADVVDRVFGPNMGL